MLRILGAMMFVVGMQAQAEAKESPWAGTEMNFDFYKQFVVEENCGETSRDYLACISSIRALLQAADPDLDIETQTTAPESNAKIEMNANNLAIVRHPKKDLNTQKRLNPKESFEKSKKEFTDFIQKFTPAYYHYRRTSNFVMTELIAYIEKKFRAQLKEEEIAGALNEYFHVASDPHSDFRPKKDLENTAKADTTDFVGIGVGLSLGEEGLMVTDVYENSGAEAAGIEPDDVVLKVDELEVKNVNQDTAIDKMRGKAGTQVHLVIERGGEQKLLTIIRRKIVLHVVRPKVFNLFGKKVGYIGYSNFVYENGCEDIKKSLQAFNEENVHGAILDLRNNGGGNIGIANCIAGLFLGPKKVSVLLEENTPLGKTVLPVFTKDAQLFTKPLTVLINERSGSASELLAGALKDYNRALIVGQRSFGKGSSQSPVAETEDTVFYATNGLFFLPSGKTNQTIGIVPHVSVYRSTKPKLSELYAKREKDLYLFPLEPRQTEVNYSVAGFDSLVAPAACIESKNAVSIFEAYPKKDHLKDLQVLTAAAAVTCL